MATQSLEHELLGLEKQFWQSVMDKDADTANRLTDFPCIVVGAQGVASMDEKTFSKMMDAADYTLEDFSLGDDIQVRRLSDDIAIIAYKAREKLTVENKPINLEAAEASVWVRRDGRWRCALHTESLTGDPYGRDRKTTH